MAAGSGSTFECQFTFGSVGQSVALALGLSLRRRASKRWPSVVSSMLEGFGLAGCIDAKRTGMSAMRSCQLAHSRSLPRWPSMQDEAAAALFHKLDDPVEVLALKRLQRASPRMMRS
jgi:hypothetical protein